jgi:hypothetical protein
MPRLSMDNCAPRNHHFHTQALWAPDTEEVIPQVEIGVNPHEVLRQSHKGHDEQDPRGGQVVQL